MQQAKKHARSKIETKTTTKQIHVTHVSNRKTGGSLLAGASPNSHRGPASCTCGVLCVLKRRWFATIHVVIECSSSVRWGWINAALWSRDDAQSRQESNRISAHRTHGYGLLPQQLERAVRSARGDADEQKIMRCTIQNQGGGCDASCLSGATIDSFG